eukprot:m.47637 g.47637  ORF g.47637 m.47637 type:complete len:68 (-) comp17683_c0_seq1:318-521(-)
MKIVCQPVRQSKKQPQMQGNGEGVKRVCNGDEGKRLELSAAFTQQSVCWQTSPHNLDGREYDLAGTF